MAHNLSLNNGKAEMMYYGELPWHGLGTAVDHVATSHEALEAAHLHWQVEKVPLFVHDDGVAAQLPNDVAIRRQDTKEILGVVGEGFRPIQNREAFGILDALVGEHAAMFHTAGALGRGEKVWALVKLPGELVIAPQDTLDNYLLLANGHTGTLALTMRPTSETRQRAYTQAVALLILGTIQRNRNRGNRQ